MAELGQKRDVLPGESTALKTSWQYGRPPASEELRRPPPEWFRMFSIYYLSPAVRVASRAFEASFLTVSLV